MKNTQYLLLSLACISLLATSCFTVSPKLTTEIDEFTGGKITKSTGNKFESRLNEAFFGLTSKNSNTSMMDFELNYDNGGDVITGVIAGLNQGYAINPLSELLLMIDGKVIKLNPVKGSHIAGTDVLRHKMTYTINLATLKSIESSTSSKIRIPFTNTAIKSKYSTLVFTAENRLKIREFLSAIGAKQSLSGHKFKRARLNTNRCDQSSFYYKTQLCPPPSFSSVGINERPFYFY